MGFTLNDIDDYQNRLTDTQKEQVLSHCNEKNIKPNICAWYDDMDDFYSDWCEELNYSLEDADSLLSDESGEFLEFENSASIIRFSI